MDDAGTPENVLSVEVFAAKDSFDCMLTVPLKCGLQDGDTLCIKGLSMIAIRGSSVLPVDLPSLSEESKACLVALAQRDKKLPVGEFLASGLANAYFLNLSLV